MLAADSYDPARLSVPQLLCPLPKGTAFSTLARYPNAIIVGGRAPLELLPATRFFVNELPRKGFRLGSAESEPGLEAEADFTGHGVVGRFKVRKLPRCSGAVLLVLSIAPGRQGGARPRPPPVRGALPACAGGGADISDGLPRFVSVSGRDGHPIEP